MALTKIKADGLTADLIDETKLADNSIDSEHYNDGSIDEAHIADDAVTADKLANAINTDIAAKMPLAGGTFTGDITIPDKIIHDGDTNTSIRFPAADTVSVETGGSERVRVDSSGRLLVGSTDGATYSDGGADDAIIGSTSSGKNDGITILSNSSQNGGICFADGDSATSGLVGYVHNGDYLRFFTGGSLRLRLDSDGLKFGSDTAAANALADYEEGTFTATCNNGVTLHSGGDLLSYTKIGRLVTVRGQININSSNSNSEFNITNMPFANENTNEDSDHTIGAVRVWGWDLPSDCINPLCMMSSNGSNLQFYCNRDNTTASSLTADGNAYLALTITYFTDA